MDDWMRIAFDEAEKALVEGEVPVGAVLVCDGVLLWRDHNRREQLYDPTAHAEVLCLRNGAAKLGSRRLEDCTLYVTLEPCAMCAGAMLLSSLGACVFAAEDQQAGCCGSIYDLPADPALHGKTRWSYHPDPACAQLLSSFFKEKRGSAAAVDQ